MQPENRQGAAAEGVDSQSAQRETNYLILRSIESQLDGEAFNQLLTAVEGKLELPQYVRWDGSATPRGFFELKAAREADLSEQRVVHDLVQAHCRKNSEHKKLLSHSLKKQYESEIVGSYNLYAQARCRLTKPIELAPGKAAVNRSLQNFERLKTVFCHANMRTDEVSSIYNVYFDGQGKFIVSAGDEGSLKVWDRQTLMLQACLQGHTDYITEISVSLCSRFIASAGKDTTVVIWELATGKLIYRLTHHSKLVNCVRFFTPKLNLHTVQTPGKNNLIDTQTQQYLFTCSDDGTVHVFDVNEIKIDASQGVRDQTSLYYVVLAAPDHKFNTNSLRNKKLDTMMMNYQGLVVAGSSSGELLVWRLNYEMIRQKKEPKTDCSKFIGSFKMPRQSCIKFCEFSPKNCIPNIGNNLMTGSSDGTITLWNMAVGDWNSTEENQFNLEDKSRVIYTIDEISGCRKRKNIRVNDPDGMPHIQTIFENVPSINQQTDSFYFSKSVCDAVRWSITGRYVIAAVTIVQDNQGQQGDTCKLKVFDAHEQHFNGDFTKFTGKQLPKNTFVLQSHPIQDEILMTGSDGGEVSIWDIRACTLLKQFKQYGVYSVNASIMDNPLHGSWSRDGKAFLTGNSLGTISYYAQTSEAYQYESTRVQQFFEIEQTPNTHNQFERLTDRPHLCGYNMAPYEVQPDFYQIRFTEPDRKITPIDFQNNQQLAVELGLIEERYYADKLAAALNPDQPAESNPDQNQAANEEPTQQNPIRRPRAPPAGHQNRLQRENSNQDANSVSGSISGASPARNGVVRQIRRTNNNLQDLENVVVEPIEPSRVRTQIRSNQSSRSFDQPNTSSNSSPLKRAARNQDHLLIGDHERTQLIDSQYLSENDFPESRNSTKPMIDPRPRMLIQAQSYTNLKFESVFSLSQSASSPDKHTKCELCGRSDGELIGPFTRRTGPQKHRYFHRDCLEINTYSYYSQAQKQYLNIDIMLKNLAGGDDASHTCFRCDTPGASVACVTCGKCFHGWYCASMYLLPQVSSDQLIKLGDSAVNQQYWQCLFCQNTLNFNNVAKLKQGNYLSLLGQLNRTHMLQEHNHQAREHTLGQQVTYLPQLDDIMVYFWQGHEDYYYQYNCHFYAGQQQQVPVQQTMPWLKREVVWEEVKQQECVLVKVVQVKTLFPSHRSICLINQFGKDQTDVVQTPQLIQRVKLQLVDQPQERFHVDLFPNQLPDFLVHYQIYSWQREKFRTNQKIGQLLTVRSKTQKIQKMKLVQIQPQESLYPRSAWQTLLCEPAPTHETSQAHSSAKQRGRSSARQKDQTAETAASTRVNWWDVVFDQAPQPDLLYEQTQESEQAKLKQHLQSYIQKNKDQLVYLKERVQQQIAPDYRQIIPSEMWFDLISARLQNHYYRSSRQFFADIEAIKANSATYNGEQHNVTQDAKEIVKRVSAELQKHVEKSGEQAIKDRISDARRKLEQQPQQLSELEESKDEASPRTSPASTTKPRSSVQRRRAGLRTQTLELAPPGLQTTNRGFASEADPADNTNNDPNKRQLRKRQRIA